MKSSAPSLSTIVLPSNFANGSPGSPGFVSDYQNGDFQVSTADQKTAFTGFASNGVYLNGADGPACSFQGYVVLETSPAAG